MPHDCDGVLSLISRHHIAPRQCMHLNIQNIRAAGKSLVFAADDIDCKWDAMAVDDFAKRVVEVELLAPSMNTVLDEIPLVDIYCMGNQDFLAGNERLRAVGLRKNPRHAPRRLFVAAVLEPIGSQFASSSPQW